MTATPEFQEASARACIRALRGLEQTAIMLEKWGPETFPVGEDGKIHFGRAITDSAAEAIRDAWRVAMSQVDTSKPLTDYERGRRDAASDILLLA